MKYIVLVLATVAVASCSPLWSSVGTDLAYDDYEIAFENFKVKFNKHYDQIDEPHRFDIFSQNYKSIIEHNENYAKGLSKFKMTVTRFTDLTRAEYIKFLEEEAGGKTLPPWW